MKYLHQLLIQIPLDYFTLIGTGLYLVLLILCLSAICYYCYAIYAAIEFFSHPTQVDPDFHPPITILKPICGLDIDTYENFASFCQQDYPDYQIIFGVRDERDLCVEVVKKIIDDFPEIDISLVVSDRTIGTNLKVSNLANAEAEAKYSLLLLADSDVRVGSDYLRRVIQPMRDPLVGVVTCLYRPVVRGWVAILEAVGISTEYHASILVARSLEGMKFALGPTIVIRKTALVAVGGFLAIADYLADDFQLGYLPAQAGYKVVLSDYESSDTLELLHASFSALGLFRAYLYPRHSNKLIIVDGNGRVSFRLGWADCNLEHEVNHGMGRWGQEPQRSGCQKVFVVGAFARHNQLRIVVLQLCWRHVRVAWSETEADKRRQTRVTHT